MKKICFLTGSQFLYGEETLKQVELDSKEMVSFLSQKNPSVQLVFGGVMTTPEKIEQAIKEINYDNEIIGVIVWCHTFSPAKMWINGLKILHKPMMHLHTQFNEKLPYDKIDMDFMNLNQAAHGDREFSYILTRLNIVRKIVVGYYKHESVLKQIASWISVVKGVDFSKSLKICRFGDNMREVAVTDGDRVEAHIKLGWQTDYYGIGDIVEEINTITDDEVDALYSQLISQYDLNTDNIEAVKEQVKYEIALHRFFDKGSYKAFTTNFQDLHGLKQLFGLSAQRLMAQGYGFGAEGDWKVAAFGAIMSHMAEGREGATAFMEDYTYDLTEGQELVLESHMLEVSPVLASNKPKIEVHPLGIGGKEDPARLVFDGIQGDAISLCMVDMGDHFRLICAHVELVKQPQAMPNLPVARVMWKLKPDFKTGAQKWLEAGGAHHTVVSTAITAEEMKLFCQIMDIEFVEIG